MLQNATPLRKSAAWPPNISDQHVSCTAPATRNPSLQILFQSPTPAIVFGNATKPSRFAHFCQGGESRACHTKCFIIQKWSEPLVFLTFWLRHVLHAKTACTFSISQLPKVVRKWCVLYILTSKCASRYNGVHFFDISTSKSGPRMVCFVHFGLRNVLRATTPCTFSTSQLQKVLRTWGVFSFFSCKFASRHNGVHFFDPKLKRFVRFDLEMCFPPQLFRHRNF